MKPQELAADRDELPISGESAFSFVQWVIFRYVRFGDTRASMSLSIAQITLYLLVAAAAGAAVGWLIRGIFVKRHLEKSLDKWQIKYDEAARQRDRFNAENTKLRTSIEAQQAVLHKHELAVAKYRTELGSVVEKAKGLGKELFSTKSERDEYQRICNDRQSALAQANYQVQSLEEEFKKTGTFYKGELQKSLDKRRDLESRVDDAMAEHESLTNLLDASQRETESVNKMLTAAQKRLENIDAMEQKVIELEAENAELRHGAAGTRQTIEALQRDVAELDELKIQNKELSSCLRSMETSRRQYERDAKRYRDKADQSDKRSETLSLKLDDVEKSFAEMAKQHDAALKVVKSQKAEAKKGETNGSQSDKQEIDDLTQIVGIGKVFEKTLHELGIYSFRQIANFGPSDIARVNMELKEFKGRMEQDDWVGQARELYFQKYGGEVS
jgi:predicted flap endonuclease-1-like 5' DNA nuclease